MEVTNMADKKSKRRRHPKKPEKLEKLQRKIAQGPYKDYKLLPASEDAEKMSVILRKFVEPYIEFTNSEESYRKLITLAVLAWNASLLPEKDAQVMIDDVFKKGLPKSETELIAGLREIVDSLVARKKAYFSKYRRQIIDFDVEDLGNQYYISVASIVEDDGSQAR
jgi:hypothetical protein